ncbi:MAG: hypothetical protein WCP28_20930 [Actinomycetes bacterium]
MPRSRDLTSSITVWSGLDCGHPSGSKLDSKWDNRATSTTREFTESLVVANHVVDRVWDCCHACGSPTFLLREQWTLDGVLDRAGGAALYSRKRSSDPYHCSCYPKPTPRTPVHTVEFRANGLLHNFDGPARLGRSRWQAESQWEQGGQIETVSHPARVEYWLGGLHLAKKDWKAMVKGFASSGELLAVPREWLLATLDEPGAPRREESADDRPGCWAVHLHRRDP